MHVILVVSPVYCINLVNQGKVSSKGFQVGDTRDEYRGCFVVFESGSKELDNFSKSLKTVIVMKHRGSYL